MSSFLPTAGLLFDDKLK